MANFPWLPMMAISVGLIAHSYALTNIFPYVGYMVEHFGVADSKDEAGFYAGYLASAFMLGRFSSSYFWGRVSDVYGRLPVFYIGLWATVITSLGFGLSTSLFSAVTFRFMLGALSGIVGVGKTLIPEVCGPEHELVGMTALTATWSIGYVIGPALGGILADPVKHFPGVFSQTGIFGRFPYLLPNLVGAGIALLGIPSAYFWLRETLPAGGAAAMESKRCCMECVGPVRLLADERIRKLMLLLGVISFVHLGTQDLYPLWAISSTEKGGLDWTTLRVGETLSIVGVMMMVFQICVYPAILRRVGAVKTQRWASAIATPLLAAVPTVAHLRQYPVALKMVTAIVIFVGNSCVSAMYINLFVEINNTVSGERRGEVNGLEMMIASLAKALGPIFISITFAWSISDDQPFPLGVHLAFVILALGMVVVVVVGWNIVRGDADAEAAYGRPGENGEKDCDIQESDSDEVNGDEEVALANGPKEDDKAKTMVPRCP